MVYEGNQQKHVGGEELAEVDLADMNEACKHMVELCKIGKTKAFYLNGAIKLC